MYPQFSPTTFSKDILFKDTHFRIRSCSGTYSVLMRENTDQSNSEYGHFLRSAALTKSMNMDIWVVRT